MCCDGIVVRHAIEKRGMRLRGTREWLEQWGRTKSRSGVRGERVGEGVVE